MRKFILTLVLIISSFSMFATSFEPKEVMRNEYKFLTVNGSGKLAFVLYENMVHVKLESNDPIIGNYYWSIYGCNTSNTFDLQQKLLLLYFYLKGSDDKYTRYSGLNVCRTSLQLAEDFMKDNNYYLELRIRDKISECFEAYLEKAE